MSNLLSLINEIEAVNIGHMIKKRNFTFVQNQMKELISWKLLPIGQLSVFFHAANGLGLPWGDIDDETEQRNYNMFRAINPNIQPSLIGPIISGSFKPNNFIHPFEKYYTTPGYLDVEILPHFFETADELANRFLREPQNRDKGEEFLSFIYIYFLVCHPFIEGNGRVARNLLDYYNQKIGFELSDVWNKSCPEFKAESFHTEAFNTFYSEEARLGLLGCSSLSDLPMNIKYELTKMADYLIRWADEVKNGKVLSSYKSITIMAEGIMKLQQ
jgi:hypothetical protein